jgi:hypothetical protein
MSNSSGNFQPDDPRITAYLLDELSPEEKALFEKALSDDPELRQRVEATRSVIEMLQEDLGREASPGLGAERKEALERWLHLQESGRGILFPGRRRQFLGVTGLIAVAASLTLLLGIPLLLRQSSMDEQGFAKTLERTSSGNSKELEQDEARQITSLKGQSDAAAALADAREPGSGPASNFAAPASPRMESADALEAQSIEGSEKLLKRRVPTVEKQESIEARNEPSPLVARSSPDEGSSEVTNSRSDAAAKPALEQTMENTAVVDAFGEPVTGKSNYSEMKKDAKKNDDLCEVHGVKMEKKKVPIEYGIVGQEPGVPPNVREKQFPHALEKVFGGCVVRPEKETEIWICPSCQSAERDWKSRQTDSSSN